MKPTKILSDRSWTDIMTSPNYDWEDKLMPLTQETAKAFNDIITWPADIGTKIYWWTLTAPAMLVTPFIDAIWSAWNAALNWYKRLYNYWADLSNQRKLELIDKQIKEFQKEHPNKVSQRTWKKFEYKSPEEKVREAWAATDAEVWAATHKFWYWNDPRKVFRVYRYKKVTNDTPRVSL